MNTHSTYRKAVQIIILLCLLANTLTSQQDCMRGDELSLRVGLSSTTIKDLRIGSVAHTAWSPKYDIGYSRQNEKRISEVRVQFTAIKGTKQGLLGLTAVRPALYYSYQRKVRDGLWFGGFFDHNTLLNFPKTRTSLYNNSPISYTIGQSIGPRLTYTNSIAIGESDQLCYRVSTQAALLTYMIQPAYAHPYPADYLKEDTFSPTREGMTWPLMKSGKVATIDKVRSFRVELGIFFYVNDRLKVSIDYQGAMHYANTTGKALDLQSHDVFIGAAYRH